MLTITLYELLVANRFFTLCDANPGMWQVETTFRLRAIRAALAPEINLLLSTLLQLEELEAKQADDKLRSRVAVNRRRLLQLTIQTDVFERYGHLSIEQVPLAVLIEIPRSDLPLLEWLLPKVSYVCGQNSQADAPRTRSAVATQDVQGGQAVRDRPATDDGSSDG